MWDGETEDENMNSEHVTYGLVDVVWFERVLSVVLAGWT